MLGTECEALWTWTRNSNKILQKIASKIFFKTLFEAKKKTYPGPHLLGQSDTKARIFFLKD